MNKLTETEREIYEELSKDGKDIEVLKKAIKQLLHKIVSDDRIISSNEVLVRGKSIKFVKIEKKDESGDIHIKYHLLIEFQSFEMPGGLIDGLEIAELAYLEIESDKRDLVASEQRRIEYLRKKKEASPKAKMWNKFMKNLGMREVEVKYELDEERM